VRTLQSCQRRSLRSPSLALTTRIPQVCLIASLSPPRRRSKTSPTRTSNTMLERLVPRARICVQRAKTGNSATMLALMICVLSLISHADQTARQISTKGSCIGNLSAGRPGQAQLPLLRLLRPAHRRLLRLHDRRYRLRHRQRLPRAQRLLSSSMCRWLEGGAALARAPMARSSRWVITTTAATHSHASAVPVAVVVPTTREERA